MKLEDLVNKTCLIGLSYFDTDQSLMKQDQLSGRVVSVDEKNGISLELYPLDPETKKGRVFVIPPHLSPWFNAPAGDYRNADGEIMISNPDYFVTWDIYKTQDEKKGDHEWWEWVPRTEPPKVN